MGTVAAFVAHSFDERDQNVNRTFLEYLNSLEATMDLTYQHAEEAEGIGISEKVKKKIENKQLFIGIFTKKQLKVDPDKLHEGMWWKKRRFAYEKDCTWSPSEWVIQESGYALGKGMKLLFLVEKGVTVSAALQGDMERVEFKRENPTECFTRLSQTLGSIKKQIEERPAPEQASVPPPEREPNQENQEVSTEPTQDDMQMQEFRKDLRLLRELIIEKHDLAEAKKELERIIASHKADDVAQLDEALWKKLFYRLKIKGGYPDGFTELRRLADENPTRRDISESLADAYRDFRNYPEAASQYLSIAESMSDKTERLDLVAKAVHCLAQNKSFDKASDLLLSEFAGDPLSVNHNYRLFKELSNLFEQKGDIEEFIAFSEKTLQYSPSDQDVRFSLGHKASITDRNALALYHYRILCDENPTGGSLNNIALLYDQLKMPAKSVEHLARSITVYQETLASANLADKYIKEGFFDDAYKLLAEAKKAENYHNNVDSSMLRLSRARAEEEAEEARILESVQSEREFMIRYAGAYAFPHKVDLSGEWETKHGNIPLSMSGTQIKGEHESYFPSYSYLGYRAAIEAITMSRPAIPGSDSQKLEKKTIRLTGHLSNRAIKYKMDVIIGEAILGSQTKSFEGLMIASESGDTIAVMEKEEKGKDVVYYQMKRVSQKTDGT